MKIIKKLICKYLGHTDVEQTMANIITSSISQNTFPIICKRCGKDINSLSHK